MIWKIRIIALFTLSIVFSNSHASQAYCSFDESIKSIYKKIINLDLELAANELGNKSETSSNLAYLLMENEIDFYSLYIYDLKSEFEKKKSLKDNRLELLEKSDLPMQWKRFLKAEILLQWALLYLKQDENFRAFQSIRESISLLEQNSSEFPDFAYSYKSLGILHTLLSTIPSTYQWASSLLGLRGNLKSGKWELQKYIRFAEANHDLFLNESYAAMSFVISYLENKSESAFQYWNQKTGIADPSILQTLVQCKLAAKAGYNDAVIIALLSLEDKQKVKLPYLYFMQGLSYLQKEDVRSDVYFQKFLQLNSSESFVKEAYQKLAWSALLQNNPTMYHLNMSNCLTKGRALTDEERQAESEAKSNKIPDLILLRSRLLFDGGYFQKAFEILNAKKDKYYSDKSKKLECAYRLGRICQMKKEYDKALEFYNDAQQFDSLLISHMSCNAILQSGVISELLKKQDDAKMYYEKVLETNPDQYKRSLHQKAKAGLERLEEAGN